MGLAMGLVLGCLSSCVTCVGLVIGVLVCDSVVIRVGAGVLLVSVLVSRWLLREVPKLVLVMCVNY